MEDYKYKLSIIIPMYNCEKYIANCLDSILNSELPKGEYEVVIINDGSKDRGPEIAKSYVSKHKNFKYLTQENQGQSVARNYGIREAKGEYVWFVDGDDIVDSSVIYTLYRLLCSLKELDILAFKLKCITENNEFISYECVQPSVKHDVIIPGREAILSGYSPSSVCALIINKNFIKINSFKFKEGLTQQDVELSYQLFSYAKYVFFSDLSPYIYIHHNNSTSQSKNPQKRIKYECDKVEIIKSFYKLSKSLETSDKELSKHIEQFAKSALFGCVYGLYKNKREWKSIGVNKAVISKLKLNNYYPLKGSFGSFKKNIVSTLLNIEALIR